jgi:hypothetical protein
VLSLHEATLNSDDDLPDLLRLVGIETALLRANVQNQGKPITSVILVNLNLDM